MPCRRPFLRVRPSISGSPSARPKPTSSLLSMYVDSESPSLFRSLIYLISTTLSPSLFPSALGFRHSHTAAAGPARTSRLTSVSFMVEFGSQSFSRPATSRRSTSPSTLTSHGTGLLLLRFRRLSLRPSLRFPLSRGKSHTRTLTSSPEGSLKWR